jgi:hypothetical protein
VSAWKKTKATLSRSPLTTVTLPPSGFADDYDLRPEAPVEIGIRVLSTDTLDTARSWAAKKAARRHPNLTSEDAVWCEAFNEALMQWIVARCTCKADDVLVPYWACAEDVVPIALSPAGLLRLFEEYEMQVIGFGILSPELGGDGCAALGEKLTNGTAFQGVPVAKARQARRLLARVNELLGAENATNPPNDPTG